MKAGGNFQLVYDLSAETFEEAGRLFAVDMEAIYYDHDFYTFLDISDGVEEAGYYNSEVNTEAYNEVMDIYCAELAKEFLVLSKEQISNGFYEWEYDVYKWEMRDNFEFIVYETEDDSLSVEKYESMNEAQLKNPRKEDMVFQCDDAFREKYNLIGVYIDEYLWNEKNVTKLKRLLAIDNIIN
jgi:hypothetical protein